MTEEADTGGIKFKAFCVLGKPTDSSDPLADPLGAHTAVGLKVMQTSGQVWTFDGDDYDAWAAEIANQVRAQVHEAVGMAIAEAVAVEPTAEPVAA